MSYTFSCKLDSYEEQKMNEFITRRKNKVAEEQIARGNVPFVEPGRPYSGCSGGSVTLSFTPTSIGTVIKVTCWGETLDITNYETWLRR